MAQTITVNGTPMLVSDDISFPFWLESGSSISPEVPVSSISVLEFNIVPNNNGNDMVFNQVISVTEGQTVPEGKTWKVESVLVEKNSNNLQSDLMFVENSNGLIHLKIDSIVTFTESKAIIVSEILPTGGGDIIESGICFSSHNANPTVLDNIIRGPISSQTGVFNSEIDLYNSDTTVYVRAFATNLNGVSYSEAIHYSLPEYYVGKQMFGGIIFHVNDDGQTGIVVALNSLGSNTKSTAVSLCDEYTSDGYTNWSLPSLESFELLNQNVGLNSEYGNLAGLSTSNYWTNTCCAGQSCYYYNPSSGNSACIDYFNYRSILPIKYF